MDAHLEREKATIVLLGSFNPAIFQPAWFAAHDLIPSDEHKTAQGVTLAVAHQEVTDFSTDDFQLQVLQQRLMLGTGNRSYYSSLKDLTVGTFRILRHTPVTKMGLNREFHFRMPSEKDWHAVGDRLAPKTGWGAALSDPKMLSISMRGSRSGDRGFIRVRVEGSLLVQPFGIFVEVNDHYEVADENAAHGCTELIDVLARAWDDSLRRADAIAERLISGA